jgi:hypothetical protein
MATAIEAVMDEAGLREQLRAGALQLADEWFSWQKAIDHILETLTAADASLVIEGAKGAAFPEGFDQNSVKDSRSRI